MVNPSAADHVLLIHGFGASSGHWRHTMPGLADGADVLAVDLLGFGSSDKPTSRLADEPDQLGSVVYSFDLWAELICDLITTGPWSTSRLSEQKPKLHLVGNSIGAVVALNAARLLQHRGKPPHQVILIDCAQRKLDDKRLLEQPLLARRLRPLLKVLVRQRWVIAPLFHLLARPGVIRQVLRQAYPSGHNVDDELIALLYRPSTDPGAVESFRGFINLFADHLAPELLADLCASPSAKQPQVLVRLIWGDQDPWEDPHEAKTWASSIPCIKELQLLKGVGHCPHDEAPELVNPILRRWILNSMEADGDTKQLDQPGI